MPLKSNRSFDELTPRSQLLRTWAVLSNNLARLFNHESNAIRASLEDGRNRVVIATQAGDIGTLIRDQIELLPNTRARAKANYFVTREIVFQTLQELADLGRANWHSTLSEINSTVPWRR